MSRPDTGEVRRARTKLLLIFALFLLPPVSAWLVWQSMNGIGASTTTNAGTLVAPARPLHVTGLNGSDGRALTIEDLRGHWTYVMFVNGACETLCERQLYLTRQIRLAMNKDIPRVQRLVVFEQAPPAALAERLAVEHEDLRWVTRDAQADVLLRDFRGDGFDTAGTQYFLVDPLGNLMMSYDDSVATKGVMKDLQKLLKISQVG